MPFPSKIITLESPDSEILRQKTTSIQPHEWALAKEIGKKLYLALQPYFPSAGLAAPQIGILKAVFLFSYDRDPQHLETVVNPVFEPIGDHVVVGWEGCLSTILCSKSQTIAKVARFEKIRATYWNAEGEKKEKVLEGFAAKAFQHEWDHLQGVLNIDRPDAEIKTFESKEQMDQFMQAVKKEDAARYKAP